MIVHVCNDVGGWGRGFVLALSKRWSEPEARFRAWHRGDLESPFGLGEVQLVPVEDELWVAPLIGQRGTRRRGSEPPIRYEAVEKGLAAVAQLAKQHGASVHMPRIGCGLAGGDWEQMEPIIGEQLTAQGVAVTVYDLPG